MVMLFSNIEGMQTKSSVQRRVKRSAAKVSVSCPDSIKFYNKSMGKVDLVDFFFFFFFFFYQGFDLVDQRSAA